MYFDFCCCFVIFSYKKWVSLTKYVTSDLAQNLQPESGVICSMAQFVSEMSTSESRKLDAQRKADMEEKKQGNDKVSNPAETVKGKEADTHSMEVDESVVSCDKSTLKDKTIEDSIDTIHNQSSNKGTDGGSDSSIEGKNDNKKATRSMLS